MRNNNHIFDKYNKKILIHEKYRQKTLNYNGMLPTRTKARRI